MATLLRMPFHSTHYCAWLAFVIPVAAATGILPLSAQSTSKIAQDRPRMDEAPPGGLTLSASMAPNAAESSTEQGQTTLEDSFEWEGREWRLRARSHAIEETQFKFNLRSMYFDRDKYDGSESEAFALGGWAGMKTGYFFEHLAIGVTGYTSQKLHGDEDKDGTLILGPGQSSYEVLGELYADIRFTDSLNLYVGRKEYDTPFINRNDSRMTPNTFEAIVLQGKTDIGSEGATLNYGAGYFDAIKDRNSDEFVSMSVDAGTEAERGVYAAGALYKQGDFSIGAIDYFSPDVINIAYAEAKLQVTISEGLKPRIAVQYVDQRSVGDDLLLDPGATARQFGVKAELPLGNALFTAAYTDVGGDTATQTPWSGYPGYTAVQVEDFNRDGESAFLLRAGYDFPWLKGLSAYALWVHGLDPDPENQVARDEYDFNLQWAPPEGRLKGLSIRLRYAFVDERGGTGDDLTDFRVIFNYGFNF
jgi:hypothetical protein